MKEMNLFEDKNAKDNLLSSNEKAIKELLSLFNDNEDIKLFKETGEIIKDAPSTPTFRNYEQLSNYIFRNSGLSPSRTFEEMGYRDKKFYSYTDYERAVCNFIRNGGSLLEVFDKVTQFFIDRQGSLVSVIDYLIRNRFDVDRIEEYARKCVNCQLKVKGVYSQDIIAYMQVYPYTTVNITNQATGTSFILDKCTAFGIKISLENISLDTNNTEINKLNWSLEDLESFGSQVNLYIEFYNIVDHLDDDYDDDDY